MKTLNIHIGYHKTATSSIQQFLNDNDRLLNSLGVHYLKVGRSGCSHGTLANMLKPESVNSAESRKIWNSAIKEIETAKAGNSLISSECFLESKNIAKTLSARLAGAFRVKIICFLRPQADWLESVFNQIIKDDYRRYTGDIYSMREVAAGWVNYHEVLKLWAEEFGYENILIRPFERRPDKKTDVYEDFLSLLNLYGVSEASKPKSLNISMHPSFTEFLRRCNTLPMLNPVHRQLVQSVEAIAARSEVKVPEFPRTSSRMSESQQASVIAMVTTKNSMLPETFNAGGIESFFSQESEAIRPYIAPDEILPVELERKLFSLLPARISKAIISVQPSAASHKAGSRLLPCPSIDKETRLNSIIIRQRNEARMLYKLLQGRN